MVLEAAEASESSAAASAAWSSAVRTTASCPCSVWHSSRACHQVDGFTCTVYASAEALACPAEAVSMIRSRQRDLSLVCVRGGGRGGLALPLLPCTVTLTLPPWVMTGSAKKGHIASRLTRVATSHAHFVGQKYRPQEDVSERSQP